MGRSAKQWMQAHSFQNSGSVTQRYYCFGSNLWLITGFCLVSQSTQYCASKWYVFTYFISNFPVHGYWALRSLNPRNGVRGSRSIPRAVRKRFCHKILSDRTPINRWLLREVMIRRPTLHNKIIYAGTSITVLENALETFKHITWSKLAICAQTTSVFI